MEDDYQTCPPTAPSNLRVCALRCSFAREGLTAAIGDVRHEDTEAKPWLRKLQPIQPLRAYLNIHVYTYLLLMLCIINMLPYFYVYLYLYYFFCLHTFIDRYDACQRRI